MICLSFRVYDPDTYKLVQTNVGHSDSIRCIIHLLPERNQVWVAFQARAELAFDLHSSFCLSKSACKEHLYILYEEVLLIKSTFSSPNLIYALFLCLICPLITTFLFKQRLKENLNILQSPGNRTFFSSNIRVYYVNEQ